jgi:PAS domain S-box-containing protein
MSRMGETRAEPSSGTTPASGLSNICLMITEHAPLPMATVEGAGHVLVYVNPAFCRLLDKSREELIGRPFRELLPEKDPCVRLLDDVYRSGKPLSHTEQQHTKLHPVFWSYTMWPLIEGGRPTGVMIQVTQTAQFHEKTLAMNEALLLGSLRQHALTEAADASNASLTAIDLAKNHFLAVLSHELRSPLNVILLWSQILKRPGGDADKLSRGLEIIDRSSRALAQLIEDLLDVHRIASGKLRLDLSEVDLADITRIAFDSSAQAAMEKEVSITREIELAPAFVSGDSARLQQVLGNLIGNAVKFTPSGGEIKVGLRRKSTRAEVTVTDTGEGISAAALPHIFERFRQEDPLSSRGHGGLGLGLAIAKQLVELHGGTIMAESAGKGAGATFKILLPLLSGKKRSNVSAAPAKGTTKASVRTLAGVFALVVDDELDNREALRRILEDADAETAVVGSAEEALEAMGQRPPDVVLIHVNMPERDGYDLVKSLRALPSAQGGQVPAIAFGANAAPKDRARALSAGFQAHLSKPVEPAKLVAAVAALLPRTPPAPTNGAGKSKKQAPGPDTKPPRA